MAASKPVKNHPSSPGLKEFESSDYVPSANGGLKPGGTTGQVPTKNSGTDFDWDWAAAGSGAVASDSIWDAKGDLAGGTGANTAARLAVGTDGMALYADASTSTGLRWGPSVITPSQITGDQDNYAPTSWANSQVIRVSGDNSIRAITSFSATFAGDRKILSNIGDYPLYIPSEHPDGTASNRVSYSSDYILYPKESVELIYDGTLSRWLLFGRTIPVWEFKGLHYQWVYGSASVTAIHWAATTSGTGASRTSTDGASGYPGHELWSTGTTNAGAVRATFSNGGLHYALFGDVHAYAECLISIPALSDGTETYTILFTIDDTGNNMTLNNNSVGIRYTHGTNSGKFQGFSRDNAGTESTADLGITVATNTLYKLRVEIDKAKTEVRYYINGAFTGRVTGNMPNSLSLADRLLMLKSAGTTARTLRVHSMGAAVVYP